MPNFDITRKERFARANDIEEAHAWLDEFMKHIGAIRKDLPGPINFHVNMTYVLSAMFCPKHDQPAAMEGDYLATGPMMAHVSVEETGKEESDRMGLPELTKKKLERVYLQIGWSSAAQV